jgi:hypothetical protein
MLNRLRVPSVSLVAAICLLGLSGTVPAEVRISAAAAAPANLGVLPAESSPRTGTWKLNLEKSRFAPDPGPRSQTRRDEHTSDGLTAVVDGVLANGSPIAYRYAPRFDGKDYPIVGTGVPSGAETIAVKHVDDFTVESTLKKAGAVVLTRREVVSADGRVLTITSQGKTVAGQPTSNMTVYDKQ